MATAEEVYNQIQNKLAKSFRELPAIVGEEVVNFSMNAFEQEAWPGHSQEIWDKRKNPNAWGQKDKKPNRALLVKTGKLRRSVRVRKITQDKVVVSVGGPNIPYAKAHLFGYRGRIKQEVKPFTRRIKGKQQSVKGFSRTINQNIPQRRYVGGTKDSPYLYSRIRRTCISHLKQALKK